MPPFRRGPIVVRACAFAAAVLWAGYALPLFFPPATANCGAPVPADAPLSAHLFPDVPAAWVVFRLACLLGAAMAVGLAARRISVGTPLREPGAPPPANASWTLALVVATGHVVAGLWAGEFRRPAQLVYIAALTLPTVILLFGTRHRASNGRERAPLLALLGVPVAWLLLRVPLALHSPRSASAVDTLGAFTYLEHTSSRGFNLITDGPFPGVSSIFFVLQGAGLFGPDGLPLTLPLLQLLNALWMALLAVGIAALAARLVSSYTAPVAAAFFLFSPFSLLGLLGPIAIFHGALIATGLLLLLLAVHRRRSPPAITAFGALAGVGAGHPLTLPFTLTLCAAALWSARRRPRVPVVLALTALLSFSAAVLPGLPSLAEVGTMRQSYGRGTIPWRPLEYMLLGQTSPAARDALLNEGSGEPVYIPLAALLTPFAIPRTPARLWGDALYDPVGTGLAACGIVLCLFAVRRSLLARGLLVLLFVALLPAFLSSSDRPSLTRTCMAPVVLALLCAVGFEAARRAFTASRRPALLALLVSAGIAGGGIVLFDAVNPEILPASSTAIALEALGPNAAPPNAAILEHAGAAYGWLQVRRAASTVPEQPVAVASYAGPASLGRFGTGSAGLILWSPGLEEQRGVSREICKRWPKARLYTLYDRTGCSHAFAAAVAGTPWKPALGEDRWSARPCGDQAS